MRSQGSLGSVPTMRLGGKKSVAREVSTPLSLGFVIRRRRRQGLLNDGIPGEFGYERLSHDWEALKGIKIAIKNVDRIQGAHGCFGEIANPGAWYTKRRRLSV